MSVKTFLLYHVVKLQILYWDFKKNDKKAEPCELTCLSEPPRKSLYCLEDLTSSFSQEITFPSTVLTKIGTVRKSFRKILLRLTAVDLNWILFILPCWI